MKFKKTIYTGVVIGLLISTSPICASNLSGKTIHICDDDAQWPPYTFYKSQSSPSNKEIIGYSIDIIQEIFKQTQIQYIVSLLPWKRCLAEVNQGEHYQMALNASFSQLRQRTYLLSKPYYSTQKHYYYSRTKYPKGLVINNIEQLKNYTLGGILGHSFESYGLDNKTISHRTNGYVELIGMLHAGRIDVFLGEHEIISGQANINPKINLKAPLGFSILKEQKVNDFYILISRNFKYAEELKGILDKGIENSQRSGLSQRLLNKYIQ